MAEKKEAFMKEFRAWTQSPAATSTPATTSGSEVRVSGTCDFSIAPWICFRKLNPNGFRSNLARIEVWFFHCENNGAEPLDIERMIEVAVHQNPPEASKR